MNSSHHRIFTYIGFVPSNYVSAINSDVVPSFSVFSEFDYVSQSDGKHFKSLSQINVRKQKNA